MINRKAICLAGGKGTRLHPLTKTSSKQLLPIYKKPVIAFPLQTLKEMGYVDILIINADEEQQTQFKKLLGNGEKFLLEDLQMRLLLVRNLLRMLMTFVLSLVTILSLVIRQSTLNQTLSSHTKSKTHLLMVS